MNIDYIEFASADLTASKSFFQAVFGWEFVDYGPDYTAFSDKGVDGGFYRSSTVSDTRQGGVLVVLKDNELEQLTERVVQAGGEISKPIFAFPGGERFQFIEPGGNELAVWRELE